MINSKFIKEDKLIFRTWPKAYTKISKLIGYFDLPYHFEDPTKSIYRPNKFKYLTKIVSKFIFRSLPWDFTSGENFLEW